VTSVDLEGIFLTGFEALVIYQGKQTGYHHSMPLGQHLHLRTDGT